MGSRQPPARGARDAFLRTCALRIAVYHPDDADGRQLTQQLQRIGCQVQTFWPPAPTLPEGLDVVFLAGGRDRPGFRGAKSETRRW